LINKDKKKAKPAENINYLYEVEHLANIVPGPGNYNPRAISAKVKLEKLKPDDWIKRHKVEAQSAKTRAKSGPDCGTYKPHPVSFGTFGKLYADTKEKKNST